MSDERLRLLERDALASGDSGSWKAYYREARRLGLGLPSGEASWRVELPKDSTPIRLSFAHPKGVDVEAIHLEWRRCGTGVSVRIENAWPDHQWEPDGDVYGSQDDEDPDVSVLVTKDYCTHCGARGHGAYLTECKKVAFDGPWQKATMPESPLNQQEGIALDHLYLYFTSFHVRAPEFLGPPCAFGFRPNEDWVQTAPTRFEDGGIVVNGPPRRTPIWVVGAPMQEASPGAHQGSGAAPL